MIDLVAVHTDMIAEADKAMRQIERQAGSVGGLGDDNRRHDQITMWHSLDRFKSDCQERLEIARAAREAQFQLVGATHV